MTLLLAEQGIRHFNKEPCQGVFTNGTNLFFLFLSRRLQQYTILNYVMSYFMYDVLSDVMSHIMSDVITGQWDKLT